MFTNQLDRQDRLRSKPYFNGAPGMNRTCDLRFRKPLLYPLSYRGGDGAKCGAKLTNTVCTVVRKATEACTAQKVLQNSLLDSAILRI